MKLFIGTLIFSTLLSLGSCGLKSNITDTDLKYWKSKANTAMQEDLKLLMGQKFWSNRNGDQFNLKIAERLTLQGGQIRAFECRNQSNDWWWNKEQWCHFYSVFKLTNDKGEAKEIKLIVKKKVEKGTLNFNGDEFSAILYKNVETKNPWRLTKFKRHFKNVKKGKLAIGMPSEYLRLVWGRPERVVNFSISQAGRKETYVYNRYFVDLLNGVVQSIHKFDDINRVAAQ